MRLWLSRGVITYDHEHWFCIRNIAGIISLIYFYSENMESSRKNFVLFHSINTLITTSKPFTVVEVVVVSIIECVIVVDEKHTSSALHTARCAFFAQRHSGLISDFPFA